MSSSARAPAGPSPPTVLAEAGLDVVVLEAGAYIDRDTYPAEPLAALRALYRDGGLTSPRGARRSRPRSGARSAARR